MNENIDLTKILEGCPLETEFYCTIFGNVTIKDINHDKSRPIVMATTEQEIVSLTRHGKFFTEYDGECILFPSKYQRDWSKFIRFWDKPKVEVEKFDPKTFRTFDKVLCRDNKNHSWRIDFFSHWVDYSQRPVCGYFTWEQSIPYNEETKHLIGTNEDCPEYYKWWKE